MIAKIKAENGQQFTSKMEGMFLDMNLSTEIMNQFKISNFYKNSPIDIEVQTLTASHWPLKIIPNCNLPDIIIISCNCFNEFYLDKFNTGRRLNWLTNNGSSDIKVI
jgi:cullin 3